MSDLVIQTKALTKRYKGADALAPLDLDIPRGTALALLGRNGAGKTTLIRALMNFITPSDGGAFIFGHPVASLTEAHRAQIAYVADAQELPEGMTVREFVSYLRPFYSRWDEVFCQKLIKMFDLPLQQKIKHLSRGQRVKVAFVAALSFHPRLLIMDEPFGGLDPAVRDEVLDALFDLMTREEWTMLVSSHEIDEVERLADNVLVLDRGKDVLRAEKDGLLARCRSVTFHTNATLNAAALPATWWNARQGEGRVSFTDSEHEAEGFRTDMARLFPDAQYLAVQPAPLKAITRALLRHND